MGCRVMLAPPTDIFEGVEENSYSMIGSSGATTQEDRFFSTRPNALISRIYPTKDGLDSYLFTEFLPLETYSWHYFEPLLHSQGLTSRRHFYTTHVFTHV